MEEKKPFRIRIAVYTLLFLGLVIIASKFLGTTKVLQSTSFFSFNFEADKGLKTVLDPVFENSEGEHAVYIVNLSSGEEYALNEQNVMPSASLYKLFLLAAAFEAIEQGKLKLEDNLSASKASLIERLGSEDFGYEDRSGTVVYPVSEAVERIGRISDNFASIMLADKIGWEKLQEVAEKIGARNTVIKEPISTTAFDIGLYFKKLYLGEVVSPDVSNKVIQALSLNQINNRIPAKLPEGLKVIHKTGELPRLRHDAGIVYLEGKPYVIVLMSDSIQFEDSVIELQAEVSKKVFEYFNK